mmetsp:Transcript_49103/g.111363  ORF Transcript_49103/g.111363 Transcript_49103/m.111363 type:complete len:211 (+) Transcript_49103:64-696(+)
MPASGGDYRRAGAGERNEICRVRLEACVRRVHRLRHPGRSRPDHREAAFSLPPNHRPLRVRPAAERVQREAVRHLQVGRRALGRGLRQVAQRVRKGARPQRAQPRGRRHLQARHPRPNAGRRGLARALAGGVRVQDGLWVCHHRRAAHVQGDRAPEHRAQNGPGRPVVHQPGRLRPGRHHRAPQRLRGPVQEAAAAAGKGAADLRAVRPA